MTTTLTTAPDLLDLLASEPSPLRHRDREAVEAAIMRAARESLTGTFSIADVRPFIPAYMQDKMIGATVTALVRSHVIEWTGGYAASGNAAQRNAHRPVKVCALNFAAVTS